MEKDKVIELIRMRIKSDEEELQREIKLYEQNGTYAPKYDVPDYSYYAGRKKAFKEAIELIGMLDKNNNK
jgi:hypothetical protein